MSVSPQLRNTLTLTVRQNLLFPYLLTLLNPSSDACSFFVPTHLHFTDLSSEPLSKGLFNSPVYRVIWVGNHCYRLNLPEIPMLKTEWPKTMVSGGAFGGWLGCESGSLMDDISALIKETSDCSLACSNLWGHSRKLAVCNLEEALHQNPPVLASSPWIFSL